jgi:hypothetical protein
MNADDELIVNLIVISKVQINTKLYTSGIYLNLEQPSYIPESVRRWIRHDSRDETIKKINPIMIIEMPIIVSGKFIFSKIQRYREVNTIPIKL